MEWRTWQYAQSLSARTVDARVKTLMLLVAWTRADPEAIRADQIAEWLAEAGDWSRNTRWTYYTNLSAWFAWLEKLEYRSDNPMKMVGRPRRAKGEPHPPTDDGIRRLVRSPNRRRTRAMILLAAFQGLRVHEIAKIRGEDLDLIDRTLVVTGKGGNTAVLPLHHMVVEIAYQMPRKGFWFPGVDRGHQRREGISDTIKDAMVRAGVAGSAHSLRHYFGTALVRAGVDLRTTQTLMRHENLSSTAIYTAISDEQRAKGIQLIDPFMIATLTPPKPVADVEPAELRRRAAELLAAAEGLEMVGGGQ